MVKDYPWMQRPCQYIVMTSLKVYGHKLEGLVRKECRRGFLVNQCSTEILLQCNKEDMIVNHRQQLQVLLDKDQNKPEEQAEDQQQRR